MLSALCIFFSSGEMLLNEPKESTITFLNCLKRSHCTKHSTISFFTIRHNNGTFAQHIFLLQTLTSLSALKQHPLCLIIWSYMYIYTLSFTLLTRWRPESISLHIARHAILVHMAHHVTSCGPMSVDKTLQSYNNKPYQQHDVIIILAIQCSRDNM